MPVKMTRATDPPRIDLTWIHSAKAQVEALADQIQMIEVGIERIRTFRLDRYGESFERALIELEIAQKNETLRILRSVQAGKTVAQ